MFAPFRRPWNVVWQRKIHHLCVYSPSVTRWYTKVASGPRINSSKTAIRQKLPLGKTRAETGACEHFWGWILLCSRIPVTQRCSGSKQILQGGPETRKATFYLQVASEPQDSNQPSYKAVLGAGLASVSNPDESHNRLQSLYVKVQALVRF